MTTRSRQKAGFTLIEVMLAMTISVGVFCAMGILLVKILQMWTDGAGSFYLANQARAARARLLSGGLGAGTGLMSIGEIKSIKTNTQWCTLEYQAAARDEKYWIQGSVDDDAPADKSIFIKSSKGGGQTWLMMVGAKRGSHDIPDIMASTCDISRSNQVLTTRYLLQFDVGGKTHEMSQIIQTYLVNQE
ncbi:MAG: type II secretion system protein J [Kiritimatiellales bacterium]